MSLEGALDRLIALANAAPDSASAWSADVHAVVAELRSRAYAEADDQQRKILRLNIKASLRFPLAKMVKMFVFSLFWPV